MPARRLVRPRIVLGTERSGEPASQYGYRAPRRPAMGELPVVSREALSYRSPRSRRRPPRVSTAKRMRSEVRSTPSFSLMRVEVLAMVL